MTYNILKGHFPSGIKGTYCHGLNSAYRRYWKFFWNIIEEWDSDEEQWGLCRRDKLEDRADEHIVVCFVGVGTKNTKLVYSLS